MNIPYGILRDIANELKNIREILEKQSTTEQSSMVGAWTKSNISCEKWVCSECGGACWYYDVEKEVSKSNYCPNCGARMKK